MTRIIAILVSLLAFSVPLTTQAQAAPGHKRCITWDVPESDLGWRISRILIKHHWYGQPSDGAERLYSPGCRQYQYDKDAKERWT